MDTDVRRAKGGEAFTIPCLQPRTVPFRRATKQANAVPGDSNAGGASSSAQVPCTESPVSATEPCNNTTASSTQNTRMRRGSDSVEAPLSECSSVQDGEPRGGGGAGSDDDDRYEGPIDDAKWMYEPPPDNQNVFRFDDDGLTFDSRFDSGNLRMVERTAPFRYRLFLANDCFGSPHQTSNKQWFFFSVTGGARGQTINLTLMTVPNSRMYTYSYVPVVSCVPQRPQFSRMVGRVVLVKVDPPPPLLSMAKPSPSPSSQSAPQSPLTSQPQAAGAPQVPVAAAVAVAPSRQTYVNMSWEYTFEYERDTVTYFANAHPYPYSKLQRQLSLWQAASDLSSREEPTASNPRSASKSLSSGVYFHRELLVHSLDHNRIDLVTISGSNGMGAGLQEPMLDDDVPVSGPTERAAVFPHKRYVVLTARVHSGETPSSHVLNGAIDFLLHRTDERARALREHFVFVVVPMLNPDGVVRGHSRTDAIGQNLNRAYKAPSKKRQPAPYAVRKLLLQLESTKRLALFIDMHAHANKRGVFFYGNAMDAPQQVQNLLYAKLVSLNTPHFDFAASNFSVQNMYAIGANGSCKDGSSRVVLFKETGFVHCYTMESSFITGITQNGIVALPTVPGEDIEVIAGTPSPKFSPAVFADVGRGLLVSLLDLKSLNPLSRLASTSFRNLRGVALWIQRTLIVDAWEQQRKEAALRHGVSVQNDSISDRFDRFSDFDPATNELPETVTTRACKHFPPTTTFHLALIANTETTHNDSSCSVSQATKRNSCGFQKSADITTTRVQRPGPRRARQLSTPLKANAEASTVQPLSLAASNRDRQRASMSGAALNRKLP